MKHEEIQILIEKFKTVQIAVKLLQGVEDRLTEEHSRLEELTLILRKEYEDLQQFENKNLRSLFKSLLVDEKKQFEIEKQEYLQAVLERNECLALIEVLDYEKELLTKVTFNSVELEMKFNLAINVYEKQFVTSYPQLQEKIIPLNKAILEEIRFKKELTEAHEVSNELIFVYEEMIGMLKSAQVYENWGQFYSQKQIAKEKRQSYLDAAQRNAHFSKKLVLKLEVELMDIFRLKASKNDYEYDGLKKFNSTYYRSLIEDWVDKNEIYSSIEYVRNTFVTVEKIHNRLSVMINKSTHKLDSLYKERNSLISEI